MKNKKIGVECETLNILVANARAFVGFARSAPWSSVGLGRDKVGW